MPIALQENIKKKMGMRKLAYMKMVNTVTSTIKDLAKQEYTTLSKEITEICIKSGALKEAVQSKASAATAELEKALRQNKKQKKLIEKAIAHVNDVNDIFGSDGVNDDEAVYILLHFNALYTYVSGPDLLASEPSTGAHALLSSHVTAAETHPASNEARCFSSCGAHLISHLTGYGAWKHGFWCCCCHASRIQGQWLTHVWLEHPCF